MQEQTVAPVTLISGEEDFLIDDRVRQIISRVLPPGQHSLNVEVLADERATITDILNATQSMGMFSTEKVVIVKNFSYLTSSKTDKEPGKDEQFELENLQNALKHMNPGTYLIFVVYGKIDNRKKFVKALKSLAEAEEYKPFASYQTDEIVAWIQAWATKNGKKIDREGAFLLHQIAGEQLRVLDSEIQKLITYIGDAPSVTAKDVETMVSSVGGNAFALLDMLLEGKAGESMDTLHKVLHFGEQPIRLLGLMVSHFRSMLIIRSLLEEHKPFNEIAQVSGKHPFIVKKLLPVVKRLRVEDYVAVMELLRNADLAMKTGRQKPEVSLELLCSDILEITSPGRKRAKA